MNFTYTCKFCGREGIVTADEAGLSIFKPEVWIPRICCNRCGEYKVRRRGLEAAIFRVCRILETCRINLDGEKRDGLETRARENLVALTKKFSTLVCDYYRVTNIWEPDFADMIFEKPTKASVTIAAYVQGVKEILKKVVS